MPHNRVLRIHAFFDGWDPFSITFELTSPPDFMGKAITPVQIGFARHLCHILAELEDDERTIVRIDELVNDAARSFKVDDPEADRRFWALLSEADRLTQTLAAIDQELLRIAGNEAGKPGKDPDRADRDRRGATFAFDATPGPDGPDAIEGRVVFEFEMEGRKARRSAGRRRKLDLPQG